MRKKLGDKLVLYNKLDIRLAKFYNIHPDKAAAILSDIYFYVDFFDSSTIEKQIKWKRVIDYIWITHGLHMSRFAVMRWYKKMKEWRN